ncbi:hypothetical protein [Nonomuraea glycinis]|uniref:hypothetical protein n=1 Tax=Nonomuraea glycinis TaxID=2047744 RepID=UPI002E0FF03E|nr:hypothetical protein OHA68_14570 [Nonomuraea glycinis]
MNPQDAQASLDSIRRLQDRTREEIARQVFPLPYVIISSLGIFAGFAAADLPRPWLTVGTLLGWGLYAGIGIGYAHWASVRRKPTGQEAGIYVALTIVLLLVFFVSRIGAFALFGVPAYGFPSQAVVAAAVTAVVYIAIVPLVRRALRAVIQRDGRRG